ncbi:hypothetical protein M0G43_09085 [Subsaxibacter sp. CAU 1640]|uniref:hypothetical protein n=1 Tax=Subsaxibacter sp. CAU 1640 TaxID=2933271 RepID=UPI00200443F3|nr:hypothetical protein [Subsaxibacter sp. CAU 1640]MCK7590726.1 hypothetical protein [Subsaxibacter sp. CAU 1640]
MSKRKKIIIISLISIVVIGILAIVVAQNVITSKIEAFLAESLPSHIEVDYEDLSFAVLSGNLELEKPKLTIYGKTTDSINLTNEMSSIFIKDVGYLDYIFNNKISIGSIEINNPKINFYHNKLVDSKNYKSSALQKSTRTVTIGKVMITNGDFQMFDGQTDSLLLKTDKFTLHFKEVLFDESTSQNKIPFKVSSYELLVENLFSKMNDFDVLNVNKIQVSNEKASLDLLTLKTKYSKEEYSKLLKNERDHFDLSVDKVAFDDLDFGYEQDSIFFFQSPLMSIQSPELYIYRDKQVADDNIIKPLYSKMLRDLKFDLAMDKVEINDGIIEYTEKINSGAVVDAVKYSDLNAIVYRLGNTYSEPLDIDINAKFMQNTPINVKWDFDVNNENDDFEFKADIGKLYAAKMNAFSEPTMNVRLEGALHKTYFTVYGDKTDSQVNLKVNYDDFKIVMMQKKERKENKLLTVIANLFVKNDSDEEKGDFLNGSDYVVRDQTKSIFNFLWLNVSAGLKNAMTGKGNKK